MDLVMPLKCFTWITHLLNLRHTDEDPEGTFTRLPNCLIIDILSRLPAGCLLRCQRDCSMWKALISSQYFAFLHLRRARPVLIIEFDRCFATQEQNLFIFDENLNKEKVSEKVLLRREHMRNKVKRDNFILRYSCLGVLLFMDLCSPSTYFIFNPITQEGVTVQHKLQPGYLCGFYYCSSTREFKLLYVQEGESRCQYLIYSFKTKMWRKIHSHSSNFSPRVSPAVVNGALHLIVCKDLEKADVPPCANGIMVLKIDKEELFTMPHPGSVCSSWTTHQRMSLLVKEECLSFCHLFVFEKAIDIWILENYETWKWSKRYKVNLNFDNRGISAFWHIDLLDILEGELLLYWFYRGLFMYNLDHDTFRRIECLQGKMLSNTRCCRPYIKSLLTIA